MNTNHKRDMTKEQGWRHKHKQGSCFFCSRRSFHSSAPICRLPTCTLHCRCTVLLNRWRICRCCPLLRGRSYCRVCSWCAVRAAAKSQLCPTTPPDEVQQHKGIRGRRQTKSIERFPGRLTGAGARGRSHTAALRRKAQTEVEVVE